MDIATAAPDDMQSWQRTAETCPDCNSCSQNSTEKVAIIYVPTIAEHWRSAANGQRNANRSAKFGHMMSWFT